MKIPLKVLLLTLLLALKLFANVELTAPKTFTENEAYFFTIQASGEDIVFPNIDKIDGFLVEQARNSRSISNINGTITSKLIRQYRLYPTKNITLPSFDIMIDGKTFSTHVVHVTKNKLKQTNSSYFNFTLTALKKELYVGESTQIQLKFKYRKDVKVLQMGLNPPAFKDFWFKRLNKDKKYEEGNFIVQELTYLLFAQKSGTLRIEPLGIDLSVLDVNTNIYSFLGNNAKNMRVYSNDLLFDVKALPNNVNLIGDFNVSTSLDKTSVNEGETLNYKVNIQGRGNIDDLQDIQLNIADTTIYENKPIIKTEVKDGVYQGKYSKSFSLLPSSDITIPAIQIEYFDPKTQKIKTVQSKEYTVKVKRQAKKEFTLEKAEEVKEVESKVQEKNNVQSKSSWSEKIMFFLIGVLCTVLMLGLYFYVINTRRNKNAQEQPLVKLISRSKSSEELIHLLLCYIDNDEIKRLIFDLEKSDKSSFKADRNRAKELTKKYNLKV